MKGEIALCFLADGRAALIWSDAQRAIGERMIVEAHGRTLCMGHAAFHDCYDTAFAGWSERLASEIGHEPPVEQLNIVQYGLCQFVNTLGPRQNRYTHPPERV